MIWFSSDWHLGHNNIAGPAVSSWEHGYRDFDSLAQMDETIIDTMNKYIGQDDELYFLGDFCLDSGLRTAYRSRIRCKTIHFLQGNHDRSLNKIKYLYMGEGVLTFTTVQAVATLKYEGFNVFMSHYAHLTWPNSHRGSWMLHGHSHGSLDHLNTDCKRLDVGIDVAYKMFGEHRPFSFDELKDIMEVKGIKIVDHHDGRD